MRIVNRVDKLRILSYSILRRKQYKIDFKVKLYSGENGEYYYHNEYNYNLKNNTEGVVLKLSPSSAIYISDNETSDSIILSETCKNRFIRKSNKLIQILDAYDDGEIDIITVDSSGTHISNKINKIIEFNSVSGKIKCEIFFNEENASPMVNIKSNNVNIIMTIKDFILFFNSIKDISYSMMTIGLIDYSEYVVINNNKPYSEFKPSESYNLYGGRSSNIDQSLKSIETKQSVNKKPLW